MPFSEHLPQAEGFIQKRHAIYTCRSMFFAQLPRLDVVDMGCHTDFRTPTSIIVEQPTMYMDVQGTWTLPGKAREACNVALSLEAPLVT